MQQVQLYYRRYRRYSCTTGGAGGAGDAAVPNFGTGTVVFKCISPIDAYYRNGSRCSRYSCTTGGTGDAAVLQEMQEIQLCLILVQERGYSRVYDP